MTTREKEEKGIESVPCTGETAESQADDSAAETMIAGVESCPDNTAQSAPNPSTQSDSPSPPTQDGTTTSTASSLQPKENDDMAKKDSPTRKLIRRMLKLKALKGNTKKRLVTKSNKMGST